LGGEVIMLKKYRIYLVDDHSIVRYGMKVLIEKNEDLEVCGEASSLEEAYRGIATVAPDLVLLDLKLPDGDGVIGCRELKKINNDLKIIILTAYTEEDVVVDALKSGADGYLLKTIDGKSIINSIYKVLKGESIVDNSLTNNLIKEIRKKEDLNVCELTSKEKQILELISCGMTNKEISKEIFIAEKTVRNYVSTIMRKINVTNRTEAARFWLGQKSLK
jgi:two-component system, NarL family, response regulator DevR